jgi:hypothetical protein
MYDISISIDIDMPHVTGDIKDAAASIGAGLTANAASI